jgi:NTE family protein
VSLIGSRRSSRVARELADLVIRPRDGVGLLEFHQLNRIVEPGRRAAVEALGAPPELFG